MDCLIIGVAGGTGSGKSTFTNRIKDEFGDRVTMTILTLSRRTYS